jgi:hypothetical protein
MSITVSDDENLLNVYKSCGNYIVTLKIDPSKDNTLSRKVDDKRYAKYRCKRALVVSIVNKDDENQTLDSIESDYTNGRFKIPKVIYKVGEWVESDDYNKDVSKVCSSGIHFYTTREAAWHHNKKSFLSPNFTGRVNTWIDDGELFFTEEYHLGITRKEIQYNKDGSVYEETEYNENGDFFKRSSYFLDGTQTVTHSYNNGTHQTSNLPLQSVQPNPLYGQSFFSSAYRSPVIPSGFSLRAPMVLPYGFSLRAPMVLPYGFSLRAPMVLPSGFSSRQIRSGVQFQPVVHPTHFY